MNNGNSESVISLHSIIVLLKVEIEFRKGEDGLVYILL